MQPARGPFASLTLHGGIPSQSSQYQARSRRTEGSAVSLGTGMGEGLSDHLDIGPFVNADIFAAHTLYSITCLVDPVASNDSMFVAPEDLPLTDLVVFPEFLFAGRAPDDEHRDRFLRFGDIIDPFA
jgi:hypothetical protein